MKDVSPAQVAMTLSTHHRARVFWASFREIGTQLSDMMENRDFAPTKLFDRLERALGCTAAWSIICQGQVFLIASDEGDHVRFAEGAKEIEALCRVLDNSDSFQFEWYILEEGRALDFAGRDRLARAA